MSEMTRIDAKEHATELPVGPGRLGRAIDRFAALTAVIVLFVVFSFTANNFFTIRSVLTLALQTSTVTIMGIGVLFTILTGGIDLSIGSVVARKGTIGGIAASAGVPIWLSWIIGVFVGALCGLANGFMITRMKLAPFIATLGMLMVARGVALTITNAYALPGPEGFGALGNDTVLGMGPQFPGISYPVLIMIAVALICHFVLNETLIGRYIYAVGSNQEAARLSGIRINRVKIVSYMVSGFMAGLVGVILASRMLTAQPNSATGYEMNAIAAAVIGGTSLMGGVGTVGGTVIGSFIIGILTVGMTMAGANYFMQTVVIGLVVIGAVYVDQFRLRYRK